MTDPIVPDDDALRARQRSRSLATAIALAAFCVLMYSISIAKLMG